MTEVRSSKRSRFHSFIPETSARIARALVTHDDLALRRMELSGAISAEWNDVWEISSDLEKIELSLDLTREEALFGRGIRCSPRHTRKS